MRLTAEEIAGIKAAVPEVLGYGAGVAVFGSRADDSQRGGDIDLLVTVPRDAMADLGHELALQAALEERLGERRVDIVLTVQGRDPARPIERIAHETGVAL